MALFMTIEDDSDPSIEDLHPKQNPVQQAPASSPSAGGFFLALGCIAGAVVGGFLGQPTLGFLTGLALGAFAATGIWLFNR